MAAALLPTPLEAGAFADLAALRAWAEISDELWTAVCATAGSLNGADIAHLGTSV